MTIQLLVDAPEFWTSLTADLRRARVSVFIQALSFEGDTVGTALAEILKSMVGVDRRVLIDSLTKVLMSDRFVYAPWNLLDPRLRQERKDTARMVDALQEAGIPIRFTNPMGLLLRRLVARNHKKLVVIDGAVAYLGGFNFSDHNFAWHDMMLRIDDQRAARFLADDFLATWEGFNRRASQSFGEVELHLLDGRSNPEVFGRLAQLIQAARDHLYVTSPYLTFPILDSLRDACRRGVEVTIVVPESSNRGAVRDYLQWDTRRLPLNLRLYLGRMSHLKAMLIDDKYLIAGSSNFDYWSYRFCQEHLAIITAKDVIRSFKERVMARDLDRSRRPEPQGAVAGPLGTLQVRAVLWLFALLAQT